MSHQSAKKCKITFRVPKSYKITPKRNPVIFTWNENPYISIPLPASRFGKDRCVTLTPDEYFPHTRKQKKKRKNKPKTKTTNPKRGVQPPPNEAEHEEESDYCPSEEEDYEEPDDVCVPTKKTKTTPVSSLDAPPGKLTEQCLKIAWQKNEMFEKQVAMFRQMQEQMQENQRRLEQELQTLKQQQVTPTLTPPVRRELTFGERHRLWTQSMDRVVAEKKTPGDLQTFTNQLKKYQIAKKACRHIPPIFKTTMLKKVRSRFISLFQPGPVNVTYEHTRPLSNEEVIELRRYKYPLIPLQNLTCFRTFCRGIETAPTEKILWWIFIFSLQDIAYRHEEWLELRDYFVNRIRSLFPHRLPFFDYCVRIMSEEYKKMANVVNNSGQR